MPQKKQEYIIEKRRYAIHDMRSSVPRLAMVNFLKRGFGNGDIVFQWAKIWPSPWSELATPRRIRWKEMDGKKVGTLEVSLKNTAMNTLFAHHKGELIHRLNIWFGYEAIVDIRIVRPS